MAHPIQHVVVLMLENRSFDHLLGALDQRIAGLEGVQAGKIVPDLPVLTDENGEIANGSFIYGCQKKQRYNW